MTELPPPEKLFEIYFQAIPERLSVIRVLVKEVAEGFGCDKELSDKLVIAVNEACMNVIQHAYKFDSSGKIFFKIHKQDQTSTLFFELVDNAEPIDLDSVKPRDLDDIRPGGLGTHFIREIMDGYDMGHLDDGKGNYLKMEKTVVR
tara:strand:- start:3173 stop:3610 length:438 start_codon:yes stop_codon:yes gene_type:complete